jgi:hypothetical protein
MKTCHLGEQIRQRYGKEYLFVETKQVTTRFIYFEKPSLKIKTQMISGIALNK